MATTKKWLGIILATALGTGPAVGQSTSRVSVDSSGVPGDWHSTESSLSADGRLVAFRSEANTLVPGGTIRPQIFLHDRDSGVTTLVSANDAGAAGSHASNSPVISADGRHVAFISFSANLVPGWNTTEQVIYVRDLQNQHTAAVARGFSASISAEGRFVAFSSDQANLVPNDTNGVFDVFVRDMQTGVTTRVSVDSSGVQGNGHCGYPSISGDGRYVVFGSAASNLVANDTNGTSDFFVRDRQTFQTVRVSLNSSGAEANGSSDRGAVSDDGRIVTFGSDATNLVADDTNGVSDAFVHDRQSGQTMRVSVASSGAEANAEIDDGLSMSADGRFVAFSSIATNLVPSDTNGVRDAFVRDLQMGETTRVTVDSYGVQSNGTSYIPSISADGSCVTFWSGASNLAPGDIGFTDTFVHDRYYSAYRSFCYPGSGVTIACPCANPPSGFRRGCDNSSGTGGASLTGTGDAYLWADRLVFTTAGEKPTALSILLQGTTRIAAGVVYGQGLRCLGGALKRLYVAAAVGGSITVPNLGAGQPTVSARSAALGDSIPPGGTRFYLVYYRDPNVLGGCPSSSTFNSTQTGEVTWWP